MRCAQCGLPLSPTSSQHSCPRCHAQLSPARTATASEQQRPSYTPSQHNFTVPGWGSGHLTTPFATSGPTPAFPSQSSNEATQLQFNGQPLHNTAPAWPQTEAQTAHWQSNSFAHSTPPPFPQAGQMWNGRHDSQPIPGTLHSQYQQQTNWMPPTSPAPTPTRSGRAGFTIASLCIFTGAFLLIFVYFMASNLPPTPRTTTVSSTTGSTTVTARTQITPTTASPSPTATATTATTTITNTTGAFPGQQFIDNPQMASAVTSNARVIQAATTFKTGQQVFVTFSLHTNGQNGAVCLLWYANQTYFTHYEFPVSAGNTAAYSYTFYRIAGPAYVEIYWASTTACTDKLLAQRVNFTVV